MRVRRGDLTLSVAAGTWLGLRYPANFDVFSAGADPLVVAVADGMGAGEGSAFAGRTAVDDFVAAARALTGPFGPHDLRAAVAAIQRTVLAGARPGLLTGCTLTALVGEAGDGPGAWIVQIGDSRVYRLRDGLLELLTTDHTAAWLGAVYGWFADDPDSAAAARARYTLHRYVGHPDRPEPDVLNVSLRPGDVLCLCTDGVAEPIAYPRLADLLGGSGPPEEVVGAVLAEAEAAGGEDNATVAVVRVD